MEDDLPSPRTLAIVGAAFEGSLALLAMLLGWPLGLRPDQFIQWTLAGAIWGTAATLPMMGLLLACVRFPIWPFADIIHVVDKILAPMFRGCRVWELALISALAGLGEEMLFRGVIQEAVAGWVDGPHGVWVGLAAASVLFGLVHPITKGYVVLATLMGLYLGWLWIATGNLLVPIMAHAIYDFLALVYLARIRQAASPVDDDGRPPVDEQENGLPG